MLRLAVVAALASAIAGCGADEPGPVPTTSPPSTISSVPAAGTALTQGTARAELSGAAEVAYDLPLVPHLSFFVAPPDGSVISFADSVGNALSFGGALETGPTSEGLVMTLTAVEPEILTLSSAAGECTITFDDVSTAGVAGSFVCQSLSTGTAGSTVDMTGTFEASA